MLKIESGKMQQPLKVVLYGPEGIGKTTLASGFPDPLYIDTEGSTAHMDVKRVVGVGTWDALNDAVTEIAMKPDVCKTLVIDTADWAEQMCIEYVCHKYKKNGIEEFGYGKGYTYIAEAFAQLLAALDAVILSGRNVVITAHAKMRKFELPDEMGAYDRWEMKLSKQVAPLLKEWCDALLFLNYETFVVKSESGAGKGRGGKRVMYCTHHPCWDAKNRFGLPDKADLSIDALSVLWENVPQPQPAAVTVEPEPAKEPDKPKPKKKAEKKQDIHDDLLEQLKLAGISPEEFQLLVANKGFFNFETPIEQYPEEFINDWVLLYWDKIVDSIVNDPDRVPF